MTDDPGRATGETHGTDQEPVEAGERDGTQRDGEREGQAEDPTDLGQEEIGEEGGDSEPVVTGG